MHDRSYWTLIGANFINMLLAMIFRWSIYDVMLVYWFQSISIGIFTFYKLLNYPLEQYQSEIDEGNAFEINDLAVTKPKAAKVFIAGFFALHYGFFHLVYIIFIVGFARTEGFPVELMWSLIGALFFLGNHFYSYRIHKHSDVTANEENLLPILKKSSIGDTFNKPYARIIPIHLTIMAGAAISFFLTDGLFENRLVLLIFMGLKTIVDVSAHKKKHETGEVQ